MLRGAVSYIRGLPGNFFRLGRYMQSYDSIIYHRAFHSI
jgi:hypothetical protein